METPQPLPIPDLSARPITVGEFRANTPEKLDLLKGYLFDLAEEPESRLRFLALLLVNIGLVNAVRLAPEERWREALKKAYGS